MITSVPQSTAPASRLGSKFDFQAFARNSDYAKEALDHLLIVSGCSLTCAKCGQLAHPDETRHLTVPGSSRHGCETIWRVAATTHDTHWARMYVADDLRLLDAGIAAYDELAEPANLRDSVTLSPATH